MMSSPRRAYRLRVSTVEVLPVEITIDEWTVALDLKEVPRDAGGETVGRMLELVFNVLAVPRDAGGEVLTRLGVALGMTDFGSAPTGERWTAGGVFEETAWDLVLTRTAREPVAPAVESDRGHWSGLG